MNTNLRSIAYPQVHSFRGTLAYTLEALFVALAVVFPMAAHALGLPVFAILPMHWTILLAGMIYGWKAGLLAGLAAPAANLAITGMPIPALLPLMTIELGIYGLLAGLFARSRRINIFAGLFITLIAGRAAFAFTALLLGRVNGGLGEFLQASFAAGLPAAAAQIVLLPIIAAGISGALSARKS